MGPVPLEAALAKMGGVHRTRPIVLESLTTKKSGGGKGPEFFYLEKTHILSYKVSKNKEKMPRKK
jgi:hypothetical protein